MNISDEQNRLLIAPRRALDQARGDSATWRSLAYTALHTDDGRVFDGNKAARFAVLWASQYDRHYSDLPLLRFLLTQEITFYREATPWGLAPDLTLAGFLVAEHRQIQDAWLHWQAKNINFDTAMGYHIYHLLTPGVAVTVDEVRSSSHPERDRVLTEITAASHTDTAVEEWLARQRRLFPADPAEENLKTWANHAARLGERTASHHFLIEWAHGQPHTEKTLNTLQFHLANLGYLPEAINAQKQAIAISSASWAGAKASKLLTLVRLERRADNFPGAWQALHECEQAMPPDKDGMSQGLWRHFLREYLLLVPYAPDPATSRRLLEAAEQHLYGVPRLWMDKVLDSLIAAAEYVGDIRMIHRFHELAQGTERDRTDGSTAQAYPQQSDEPGIPS